MKTRSHDELPNSSHPWKSQHHPSFQSFNFWPGFCTASVFVVCRSPSKDNLLACSNQDHCTQKRLPLLCGSWRDPAHPTTELCRRTEITRHNCLSTRRASPVGSGTGAQHLRGKESANPFYPFLHSAAAATETVVSGQGVEFFIVLAGFSPAGKGLTKRGVSVRCSLYE